MADERWALCLRSVPSLYMMPPNDGGPGFVYYMKKWTETPAAAVQYVSKEVAELAGKYLLPLTPTVALRVR